MGHDKETTGGAERRRDPRVFVNMELDYGDEGNYLFAYIRDLSTTGIFVSTTSPETPGTLLNLRFKAGDEGSVLELEGEVIWVNAYRPGDANSLNPGMGIRFVGLTDETKETIESLVKTFAYLDG